MYLCDLKNHPESVIKVEYTSYYYNDEANIKCKHFINVGRDEIQIQFKGTVINNCSFIGFRFNAGSFKGCIIKRCRFYKCTFNKDAFIGCTVIGDESHLFGCHVIGDFTYKNETISSNDIYMSLPALMVRLHDGFTGCRYLRYLDSTIEHKRFYKTCFINRIVRFSRIKNAKNLACSVFVNCTFYKCNFIVCAPVWCSFINCTFIDCPYNTDSFRGCCIYNCKGGYDTTYAVS